MAQLSNYDLESLLRPRLGNDLNVESFTFQPLTQPGENYGSTMVALDVTIYYGQNKTSKQKLPLVAKLPPPSEFIWRLFDTPNTFSKEINCYTEVKEEYDKLQKENGISTEDFLDVFPKCYGARTTMSQELGDVADKDAVLLLENLKASNYCIGQRRVGLDLDHLKLAVSQLARFHALSVALKLLKPTVYQKVILKACRIFNVGLNREECEKNNQSLLESAMRIPECKDYGDRLMESLKRGTDTYINNLPSTPKEPYSAFGHTDFWVNNMMFCYNSENKPVGMKFLDFQGVKIHSPVKDLIFFLYSSSADGVRENHYDNLIQLYHQNFTYFLKALGCDTTSFTFESFLSEIDEFAPTEADHILFMLSVICAERKENLSEISSDNLASQSNDIFDKRVKNFILEFVKRGWL